MSDEQTQEVPADEPTPEPQETTENDDTLGDAGKKALAAERQARKEAEKKAKRAEQLEKELAKLREDAMSEQEKAIEQARREARAETAAEFNRRIAASEAKALAAGKTRDPEVAVQLLGELDRFVDEDGTVDTDAMSEALDKLIVEKQYLAVGDRQPVPDADQGFRNTNGVTQIRTREELARLSPSERLQAFREGRVDKLIGKTS
jgi:hypothetical protein